MKIIGLDKKLLILQHRISKEQYESLEMDKETFETMIKSEMYKKLADYIVNKIEIKTNVHEDHTEFRGQMYVMNERDMLNVLLEIAEMDDVDRYKVIRSVKTELGLK